jgi:sugar lactone lactonase YvrE
MKTALCDSIQRNTYRNKRARRLAMPRLRFLLLILPAVLATGCQTAREPVPRWQIETLVAGSTLHAPNGISFGPDQQLYAGSVGAQTIYKIDISSGKTDIVVAAPAGEADDIAFSPNGTLVWTALVGGEIRALRADGTVDAIVTDVPLINPLHFTTDGRLYAAQIGFDRLYEFPVDEQLASIGKPRLVASKIGNLNSFEISSDNQLFGPLSNTGTVAQIDLLTGAVTPIAEGLGKVVAVNLDAQGNIWAINWSRGELWRIDRIEDGNDWQPARLVANLEPPLDNLAVGPDGAIYISRPAHSAIDRVDPVTGEQSTLIDGHLAAPGGLTIISLAGRETLLVADSFGYRVVDTQTAAVSATFDLTQFGFPGAATAVAANDEVFALTDAVIRPGIFLVDRTTGKTVNRWRDIKAPLGILLTETGDPLVIDFATGMLIELNRTDRKLRKIIAADLAGPAGLAWASAGSVYVAEATGGSISEIDLTNGTRTVIAQGLSQPEGLTLMHDGKIAVVEVGKQRLVAIDPADGTITLLADKLPVGEPVANAPAPVFLPSGVTQGADGSLYISADRNNAILKLVRN